MISSLFKPAWKSKSADKRLQAVSTLDNSSQEDREILWQLCNDPEDPVCLAAIDKFDELSRLFDLHQQHEREPVRAKALERVNQLISNNGFLSEDKAGELLASKPDMAPLFAANASLQPVRAAAIQRLDNDKLLQVLPETSFSDVRQSIAERLHTLDELEAARKFLRGKDKNAERLLKSRIDAIRLEQREQADHEQAVAHLIEEAEYLTSHDWLPEFKARVIANTAQWERLQRPIIPADRERYDRARAIMQQRCEQQQLIDQTQEAQQKLVDGLDQLLSEISTAGLASALEKNAQFVQRLDQSHLDWIALKSTLAPSDTLQQRHGEMLRLLESALSLLKQAADGLDDAGKSKALSKTLERLDWPTARGAFRAADELRNELSERARVREQAAKEKQARLDQLHKKVSSITRFAHAGHLGRAKQIHAKVEKALPEFTGADLQRLQDRLNEAGETLGKMDDWKNFATEPKYIELCAAMEALIGSDLHPDNQAGKIKELQKQWKSLGYSAISDQYWPRFKEAADKAYEPCAEFFSSRRDTRKDHLQQRQAYVDEMQQLLQKTDWDTEPDYKAAQDAVRRISDGFSSIKDVERGEGNKQWKAFNKFRDAVFAKLDVAYDANIAAKKRLVEQAGALAESDPSEDNLGKLKMLQTRWKQIGITRRKDDQKAWKAFKKFGDQVFDKLQAQRKEKRAEDDQQLGAYRQIIKDIQTLAKSANELADTDHRLGEFQAAYQALPALPENLPEKLSRGIQRDYQQACQQVEERRRHILKRQRRDELDALRQRADLCLKLESLDDSADDPARQKIDEQWQLVELHDHELIRRIDARRQASGSKVDRDAIAEQRRLFCIKLEIATGQDSPAEDRQLRTRYQLEQMNQSGLGQAAMDFADDLEQVEVEWLCMPGAGAQQAQLDQRLYKILKGSSKK